MICPNCGKPFLRVTHTFQAGPGCCTQRRKCLACKSVSTSVVVVVEADLAHGNGAKAIAEKMKKTPPERGLFLPKKG